MSCHAVLWFMQGTDPVDLQELQEALAGGSSSSSILGCAAAQGPGRLTRATFAALSTQQCLPCLQQATGVVCFVSEADGVQDQQVGCFRDTACQPINIYLASRSTVNTSAAADWVSRSIAINSQHTT